VAIDGFPARVRDRFDILSWDPRGMGGRTTPVVQCFDGAGAEAAFLATMSGDGFPATADRLAADAARRTALNRACVERGGDLLAHVSTADNARDLDLLRQAVGEEMLSYYGTSYGTVLGATYVNMFPDRVRAAVLDGAAAAPEWVGSDGSDADESTFVRLGSDLAAATTIEAFMSACGAVPASACPFSAGSPEATRKKWVDLQRRAEAGIAVDGDTIDAPALRTFVASSIYVVEPVPGFGRFPGWAAVAAFLQQVWTASEHPAEKPAEPATAADAPASAEAAPAPGPYATSVGRQLSVVCGESPNPATEAAAVRQAEASFARAGISPWPFVAYCVGWTVAAKAPYSGPWDGSPVPVLVVGNTFDPATAFSSSVRMAQALGNARLLVVNGYGHTVLMNPSRCAQDHVAAYLIDGILPPTGTACGQDKPPFPGG
jgi:pimeloyl-ACP methyl ester carboxylesterase